MSVRAELVTARRYIIERPKTSEPSDDSVRSLSLPASVEASVSASATAPSTPRKKAAQKPDLEFTADPLQLALLVALLPDFYEFCERLAAGAQPCGKCGRYIRPSDPATAAEHSQAANCIGSGMVMPRALEALSHSIRRGEIDLEWFGVHLSLPCATIEDATLYLGTQVALTSLVKQHAAPLTQLHPSICTFTLTVDGTLIGPTYSQALIEFFEHAHRAAANDFSIIVTSLPNQGARSYSFYCKWRVVAVVDVFKLSPADKEVLRVAYRQIK